MYLRYRRIQILICFCAAEASLHATGQRVSFIEESRDFKLRLLEATKTQVILPSKIRICLYRLQV